MATPWTEAEKLGLLFQIIEKTGAIPWDKITLPEGRTKKACQVMVDKEKQKCRRMREGTGGEGTPIGKARRTGTVTPSSKTHGNKRKGADEDDTPSKKKVKTTPKAKEFTAKNEEDPVKEEPEDEGGNEQGGATGQTDEDNPVEEEPEDEGDNQQGETPGQTDEDVLGQQTHWDD